MKKATKRQWERVRVDRKIVEALGSGKSINNIKKTLKVSKERAREVRDLALQYGYIEESSFSEIQPYIFGPKKLPPFPEMLFPIRVDGRSERLAETDQLLNPHRDWIKERVNAKWHAQSIFEELPTQVPRANFYRYLHRQELYPESFKPNKNVLEIIHKPGECLQVDWGKLCSVKNKVTGKKVTVWVFIGVMGHSRYEMARVVLRGDSQTTLTSLESMFEELGGVPQKVTSDNPKVFVTEASAHEALHNTLFERFASHYGFIIEALPAATPELKGKVERQVPYIRRLFESYDFENFSLETAQDHINKKLILGNERRHGTILRKPVEVFIAEEAAELKKLPSIKYLMEEIEMPTVRDDGYVRFSNKYYRIDSKLKKRNVTVIANTDFVSIYYEGKLLEVYDRIKDPYKTKECKDHYKEPWEKTLKDHGHYIEKANAIGANVGRMIEIILARGQGFVDTRVVWGLLSLDKTYHKKDIDEACNLSIEMSSISLRSVMQLLKFKPQKEKTSKSIITTNPQKGRYQRPMSEYKSHLHLVHSQK